MNEDTVARPLRGGTGPGDWIPTSRSNPCPVCGRVKDGDCRTSADGQRVICHHPKDDLQPGEVVNGYAFTGNITDGRGGHFVIDVPREGAPRKTRSAARRRPAPQPPAAAPLPDSITLARLPEPFPAAPPEHFPRGHRIDYSPDQWTEWEDGSRAGHSKGERPRHLEADGKTAYSAGSAPWPLFGAELLHHARGQWIAAAEGPKCAQWLQAGGLVAVSQPGHDHKGESIRRRFEELHAAGIAGMAYLSDHDDHGRKKADQLALCAAAVGFPFLHLPAADVWPEIPDKGSIDDVPGSPAERVAAVEAALEDAVSRQQPELPEGVTDSPRTAAEKLAALEVIAADLLARRVAFAARLPLLRAEAETLDLTVRDQELQALLTSARRHRANGDAADMLRPGDRLDLTPDPWAWDRLVLRGALNLWVALPKVGKTSLALAWLAAWHRNEPAFLDRTLVGPCPPVLIVGTDQGQADWGRMLREVGWMDAAGYLGGPLVGLVHKGRPLHMDPEGNDRIAEVAQQHPGLVILIDSLSACIAPLGLKEESPQIADPVADLMELVEPHGATVVLIHHASKGRAGEGAAAASRGSTALPAMASQILKLATATENPKDLRRVLTTTGRGGVPEALVIEREGPSWTLLGGVESLEKEKTEAETVAKLTDRQADALREITDRWEDTGERSTAGWLAEALGLEGKDPERVARKTLQALERRGLLQSVSRIQPGRGSRLYEFWPAIARVRAGALETGSVGSLGSVGVPPREDPERSELLPLLPTDPTDPTDQRTSAYRARGGQRTGPLALGDVVEVLIGDPLAWVNGHRVALIEGDRVRVVNVEDPTDWRVMPLDLVRRCSG